jgi:hypothetical protein
MTRCRFHTDEGHAFTHSVESIPVEGEMAELAGRRYRVRRVLEIPHSLRARFGHAALVFCSTDGSSVSEAARSPSVITAPGLRVERQR